MWPVRGSFEEATPKPPRTDRPRGTREMRRTRAPRGARPTRLWSTQETVPGQPRIAIDKVVDVLETENLPLYQRLRPVGGPGPASRGPRPGLWMLAFGGLPRPRSRGMLDEFSD